MAWWRDRARSRLATLGREGVAGSLPDSEPSTLTEIRDRSERSEICARAAERGCRRRGGMELVLVEEVVMVELVEEVVMMELVVEVVEEEVVEAVMVEGRRAPQSATASGRWSARRRKSCAHRRGERPQPGATSLVGGARARARGRYCARRFQCLELLHPAVRGAARGVHAGGSERWRAPLGVARRGA